MGCKATPVTPATGGPTNGVTMDGEATLRRVLEFGVWCMALAGGTALVHALGSGTLVAPPVDPAAWAPWLEGRDPLIATMALLRLLVLAVCWYLVGVTSVGLVARLLRAGRLLRIADALTLPPVRRMLQQTLGVALATAMVTSVTGSGDGEVPAPTTMRLAVATAEDERVSTDGSPPEALLVGARWQSASTGEGGPTVTLRGLPYPPIGGRERPDASVAGPVPPADAEPDGVVSPPPGVLPPDTVLLPWQVGSEPGGDRGQDVTGHPEVPTPLTAPTAPTAPGASTADIGGYQATHTVQPGESLWRIASDRLAQEHGRAPSDAEVVPYWRELIEDNRDRLPDRDDPDLILPGQELLLPPVLA